VRARAFLPPPEGKLSVFDTDSLNEERIWRIGKDMAAGRTLHARADVAHSVAKTQGLELIVDEPPSRHRYLDGWPSLSQKEDRMLIAMELAAAALLRLP
jgi:hypothetical protein